MRRSTLSDSLGSDRHMKVRTRRFRIPFLGTVRAENLLLLFTLLAVVGGSVIGLYLNPLLKVRKEYLSARERMYLKFPGEMLMRMLRMLIVPLIIASNISAITSLTASTARLLTGLTLLFYIGTTFIAVILGLILVLIIQPGRLHSSYQELQSQRKQQ